jgi:outer membrane protease
MKPLVYLGADMNLIWKKPSSKWGFFAGLNVKVGIPGETGIMEDRDWIDVNYNVTPHISDRLTNYSVHTNRTNWAVLASAKFGGSLKKFDVVLIKPFVSYDFMVFAWSALGGSILYPYQSIDKKYYPKSQEVGTYMQTWHVLSPGISFSGDFNSRFSGEVSFKMTPLVLSYNVDNHILRSTIFTDLLLFGFAIEPSFVMTYTHNENFAFTFGANYRNISFLRGDETSTTNGKTTVYADIGGAAYEAWDVTLGVKFRLRDKEFIPKAVDPGPISEYEASPE